MPMLYALLVGINDYQAVSKLAGCVPDILSVETLLRERVPEGTLALRRLLDGEATRANIIDGFRSHLRRAGADDVALFYFCGHGSQEPCPEEWRALEPSGRNQTLLPVDARVGDVFEIADKELSVLLGEVAAGGAHVVTIFDSCHSGGVTRDVAEEDAAGGVARMAPAAKGRTRTLDDYLEEARTQFAPDRIVTHGPPTPRHVAIAACQPFETAKEFPMKPPRRGAFTAAFEEAVRALGPSASYADLVTAVRVKVRGRAREQLPNLFLGGGARGSDAFLGGHAGRTDLTVDVDAAGRWWLSAGALEGIPNPAGGDVAEVAIYPRGAFEGGARPAPIAHGVVDLVHEDRARLQLKPDGAALDPARQYLGVITRLGTPALHVLVEGTDDDVLARVRPQLSADAVHYAVVAQRTSVPCITVRVGGDQAELVGEDGVPIDGCRFATDEAGLDALGRACTHLARWYGLRDRTPASSRYNDAVVIEVIPVIGAEKRPPADRAPLEPRDGTVQLQYEDGKGPRIQLRFRNTTNERLYVALLDLDDAYGSTALFADWVPAGKTVYAAGEKAFRMQVMDWRPASVRGATDWFKLFAATSQFDVERLQLEPLAGPRARGASLVEDEEEDDATWGTSRLTIVTAR